MPFFWRRHLRALLLATAPLAFAACSNGFDAYEAVDDGDPTSGTVRFLHDGTLELAPSEVVTLELESAPGATIGVLLLGSAGNASLDRSSAQADDAGRASVVLRAPNQPSTFRVRAQVGGVAAELPVAVSELGFADLRVVPKYTGHRPLEGWVANVVVGSTCADVLALLPEDPPGALRDSVALATEVPVVDSVPVGPQLAVAIRSGALVAGCRAVTLEQPGTTAEALVDVFDRPMALGDAELDLVLGFTPESAGYGGLLDGGVTLLADSAFPPSYALADHLLDAMYASLDTSAEKNAFAQHRQQNGLDASVSAVLGDFDANAWCKDLGSQASSAALADASSDSSRIEGRLGSKDEPGAVLFAVSTWSGASAAELGVPEELVLTWSAQPGDTLVVSGAVPFSATRMAGHWMRLTSVVLYGTPDVPVALAGDLDCAAVGAAVAWQTCDAACSEALCVEAVGRLWKAGLDAGSDPSKLGQLVVGATGDATVDEAVVPISFVGSWVGTLSALGSTGQVQGFATGVAPPPG